MGAFRKQQVLGSNPSVGSSLSHVNRADLAVLAPSDGDLTPELTPVCGAMGIGSRAAGWRAGPKVDHRRGPNSPVSSPDAEAQRAGPMTPPDATSTGGLALRTAPTNHRADCAAARHTEQTRVAQSVAAGRWSGPGQLRALLSAARSTARPGPDIDAGSAGERGDGLPYPADGSRGCRQGPRLRRVLSFPFSSLVVVQPVLKSDVTRVKTFPLSSDLFIRPTSAYPPPHPLGISLQTLDAAPLPGRVREPVAAVFPDPCQLGLDRLWG